MSTTSPDPSCSIRPTARLGQPSNGRTTLAVTTDFSLS